MAIGAVISLLGVLFGVAGYIVALSTVQLVGEIPVALLGMALGALGYFLGARKLGTAAVVVGAIAVMVLLATALPVTHGLLRFPISRAPTLGTP